MQEQIEFNKDQIEHQQIVQELCWKFCNDLMTEAIRHDKSKWSKAEYETFVQSRTPLNNSRDGKDASYKKNLLSDAVQHHYEKNRHHPEYWDKWLNRDNKMPFTEIIIMFFDWASRSIAKGQPLNGFWDYNIDKLKEFRQAEAIPIVQKLKKQYNDYIDSNYRSSYEKQYFINQFYGFGAEYMKDLCQNEDDPKVVEMALWWWNGSEKFHQLRKEYGEEVWQKANGIALTASSAGLG